MDFDRSSPAANLEQRLGGKEASDEIEPKVAEQVTTATDAQGEGILLTNPVTGEAVPSSPATPTPLNVSNVYNGKKDFEEEDMYKPDSKPSGSKNRRRKKHRPQGDMPKDPMAEEGAPAEKPAAI